MTGEIPAYEIDPKTGEAHTSEEMVERAQDMSALAGPGALGASEGELTSATLGATPMLRPAVKYNGRIYKAPVGGQHLDAIPASIYPEFQRRAMSGEDISNFNFGFMNHEGQFMNREQAMDYAVREGLIDPRDARQGVLTTTNLEVMPNTQVFTEEELNAARRKLSEIGEDKPSNQRLYEAANTWKKSGSLLRSDTSDLLPSG